VYLIFFILFRPKLVYYSSIIARTSFPGKPNSLCQCSSLHLLNPTLNWCHGMTLGERLSLVTVTGLHASHHSCYSWGKQRGDEGITRPKAVDKEQHNRSTRWGQRDKCIQVGMLHVDYSRCLPFLQQALLSFLCLKLWFYL